MPDRLTVFAAFFLFAFSAAATLIGLRETVAVLRTRRAGIHWPTLLFAGVAGLVVLYIYGKVADGSYAVPETGAVIAILFSVVFALFIGLKGRLYAVLPKRAREERGRLAENIVLLALALIAGGIFLYLKLVSRRFWDVDISSGIAVLAATVVGAVMGGVALKGIAAFTPVPSKNGRRREERLFRLGANALVAILGTLGIVGLVIAAAVP